MASYRSAATTDNRRYTFRRTELLVRKGFVGKDSTIGCRKCSHGSELVQYGLDVWLDQFDTNGSRLSHQPFCGIEVVRG